jgi:hypothetical protein
MEKLPNALSGIWEFAAAHPFVSAWLAAATVWALFTVSQRDAV